MLLPAILTALCFSASILCAGRATRLVGSHHANFFRILFAFLCLSLYVVFWGRESSGPGLSWYIASGVIGIGIGDLGTFRALHFIPPRLVVLLVQCLGAPFAALIERVWLGTQLTSPQIMGGALILLGTSISLLPKVHLHQTRRTLFLGVALAVFASFSQALGAVMTRKAFELVTLAGFSITGMTAAHLRMCGGVVTVLVIYLCFQALGRRQRLRAGLPPPVYEWKKAAPWIGLNGLMGLVLGLACFQWALMVLPSAVVLSVVALCPLLVMPMAWWMDGDRPPLLAVVGGILAVAGVVILRQG